MKWKPGIHLPKKDSRIWLRVTDVRPERLGDMTETEAQIEGVSNLEEFRQLWVKLNDEWKDDQVIYRIEFRRMEWDDLLSRYADTARQIGILFSTPMVEAIMNGKKFVTRRMSARYRNGDILYVRETWRRDENGQVIFRAMQA